MIIGKIVLLVFFLAVMIPGIYLTAKRTGNHSVDYFTKMLGAFLAILGCVGVAQTIVSIAG